MNKQITVTIMNDYNSSLSYELRNENIEYLLSQLDLYCEVSNSNFINMVEQLQQNETYKDNYKDILTVNTTGYSQRDWQEYKLYYNKKNTDINTLNRLVNELEKSFTHQNDYFVTKYEEVTINNKVYKSEPIDYNSFCITNIEFPDDDDIIKEYINRFGIDYDNIEINID